MGVTYKVVLCIVLFINLAVYVAADSEEDACSINFSDAVEPCDGFNNEFIDIPTMILGYIRSENNKSAVSISGTLHLFKPIDDEYQLEMRISRVSGSSCSDVMWLGASNICASLKDEGAPWYPVAQQLGMDECPIVEAEYEMENILLEDGTSDFCSPEMVGDYCIQMSILNKMNEQISCYITYVAIEEPEKKK